MRTTLIILCCFCSYVGNASAQSLVPSDRDSIIRENMVVDSLRPADTSSVTVALADTTSFALSFFHGSVLADTTVVWQSISKHDIQPWMYTTYADVFDVLLPFFPLSLGYHGQPHGWRTLGGGMRDNALLFNGRALNDVGSGVANTSMYSPEDMERVQVLIGSAAVILADQASGMAVNIQEQRHDTKGPYSRLWYADGANNYYASDGILSQNIARNLNMTLGFKRQAGDGRFDNQWLDAWNVRARLRWMPRALTTVSLTENFSNHGTGGNGGVYTSGSADINDEVTASVRLPDVNERVFRHDLTLSVSSAADTTLRSVVQASAYMSHASSELARSAVMVSVADSSVSSAKSISVRAGVRGTWEQEVAEGLRSTLGGDVEFNRSDATDYADDLRRARAAAFAFCGYRPEFGTAIHGGARVQTTGSRTSLSVGASLRHRLWDGWSLLVDASRSARLPSAAEGVSRDAEQTLLGFAQLGWANATEKIDVLGFARRTENVMVATVLTDTSGRYPIGTLMQTIPVQQVVGAHLRTSFSPVRDLWVDATVQSAMTTRGDSTVSLLPSFYGLITLRYTKTIGTSVLTAGAMTRLRSEFAGETFVPMNWMMADADDRQAAAVGGLDLFATAKLGNAWVKLRFQNVLSNTFTTVSTFPFPVRNFSLSVAWSFFD